MFPYLFGLFLTLFFLSTSRRYVGKNNTFSYFIRILPLLLLAALRDYTIGTDTDGYPLYIWEVCAKSTSLVYAIASIGGMVEPLYIILEYVVSRFSNDMHWMLFVSHAIIFINIIFAIQKHSIKPAVGIFLYFCTFFNFSMNGARQSLALSFLPLVVFYFNDRKYIKFAVLALIAYFFHSSSALCVLIYLLCYMINRHPHFFERKVTMFLIFLSSILLILFFSIIIEQLAGMNIIRTEYMDRYGSEDMYGSRVPISDVFINGLNLFVIYKYRKYYRGSLSFCFVRYIAIFALLLLGAGLISVFLVRVALYFEILSTIYSAQILSNMNNKKALHIYGLYLFYWIMITFANLGEVNPYTSKILGI